MPYIIIRGNLASYDNKYPWRVLVSGLKTEDIEDLRKYPCGGYCDECTIVYLQHPCVILSALEKLGYMIVASSSTSVKQDYNEYMWTMRTACRDFDGDSVSQTTYCSPSSFFIAIMSHAHSCKSERNFALAQSLDEMEFERGIWSAACDGDLPGVQKFLDRGVNVDVCDAAGYTALHYAALKGHIDISRVLLNAGANINAVTRAGKATSLHRAVTSGKEEMVKFLLKRGAYAALQDVDGRTALHRAIINQRFSIATLLSHEYPELTSIADIKNKLPADYKQK